MNREHKYKDKDEYKDNDKDKDTERITDSLTVCYIFGILMTQAFQIWWWIPPPVRLSVCLSVRLSVCPSVYCWAGLSQTIIWISSFQPDSFLFPVTNIIFAFKTFVLQILGSGFNLADLSRTMSSCSNAFLTKHFLSDLRLICKVHSTSANKILLDKMKSSQISSKAIHQTIQTRREYKLTTTLIPWPRIMISHFQN